MIKLRFFNGKSRALRTSFLGKKNLTPNEIQSQELTQKETNVFDAILLEYEKANLSYRMEKQDITP